MTCAGKAAVQVLVGEGLTIKVFVSTTVYGVNLPGTVAV